MVADAALSGLAGGAGREAGDGLGLDPGPDLVDDDHCDSADGGAEAAAAAPSRDWTLSLPDEMLELVLLSGVPALDLVQSARLVCRRWRRVLAGRALWRRVRVAVRVGRERDACRVLRAVPALAELALFPEDRVPTSARAARMLLSAVRGTGAGPGLEVRALALDWRHFAADAASRACFHGILAELRHGVCHLDVGLVGVQPVEEDASPLQPRPAPALTALAAMPALTSLRLRALFDPCWYFGELRASAAPLRSLDAAGCQPYLARLLGDLLAAHGPSLEALRITARGLAAAKAVHLPAIQRLDVDLEHQDATVVMPPGVCCRLVHLTLARMNRRLPVPGPDQDTPSAGVRSLLSPDSSAWASLRTLVLEDCLVSPADLAALLHGFDRRLNRLAFEGGCFLGTADTLEALAAVASAGTGKEPCLVSRGLRLCPRDETTGLYPLALEP